MGLLISVCVFGIIFLVIFLLKIREKKYTVFLIKNSISLNELFMINNKYKFYESSGIFNETFTYDNEKHFENISCEDYLIYQLQFKKYEIKKEIAFINQNNENNLSYLKEIIEVKDFGRYSSSTKRYKTGYLLKLEERLFEKNIIKPRTNFYIFVTLRYAKMSGEVCDIKREIFDSKQISSLIDRLNDKNRNFYNDREIWESLCRVERGRVSNKIRFSIYERDNYRCRVCGRKTSDLEIDHIKPISKGGKSDYDNLQTLCRMCNKNKGDTFF